MEYVARSAARDSPAARSAGWSGSGGGILFVPALAIFLDEPQVRAEATSLLAIVLVAVRRRLAPARLRQRPRARRARHRRAVAARRGRRGRDLERGLRAHPRARLRRPRSGASPPSSSRRALDAQALRRSATSDRPVLEGALDRRVEGVQPVERQRLGRGEAARRRPRPRPGRGRRRGRGGRARSGAAPAGARPGSSPAAAPTICGADRQVAEQPALLAEPELGPVGELARLADVVERSPPPSAGRSRAAGCSWHSSPTSVADRDRVLEQAAEVGVVAAAGAGRAAELRRQRAGEDERARRPPRRPGSWISRVRCSRKPSSSSTER